MIALAHGVTVKSARSAKRIQFVSFARKFDLDPTQWTWKTATEKFFWTVIIVLFGFLTIKTALELIQQYEADPTTTQLNVLFNKTFALPTMTICLPIGEEELDVRQRLDDNETYLTYQEELSDYFNQENMSKSVFLETAWWTLESESLTSTLLHIVFMYLQTLTGAERVTALETVDFARYPIAESTREIDEWDAALLLEGEMEKLNISIPELRKKFGIELLSYYRLSIQQYALISGQMNPGGLDNYLEASYVSQYQVCYRLSSGYQPFRSTIEYIDISVYRSGLPNGQDYRAKNPIFLDLSGSDSVRSARQSEGVIKLKFNTNHYCSIGIAAVYRALEVVSGERRCSATTTESECM